MPSRKTKTSQRVARLEQVEERIVLSATPWPALAHHEYLPAVHHDLELEQHVGTNEAGEDLANIAIGQHLSGAHQATGVSNVHSDYGFNGTGQTVVVIDSGIAYDHVALGGGFGAGHRVVGGWDFAENDNDPFDDAPAGYHGTHVAGIIGSDDPTHTGVASGVDLVALRVFDDSGNGSFAWVDQALQWVIDNQDTFANPITTVNLSLGVPEANYADAPAWAATLDAKFQTLNAAGIFVAVSAGNDFEMFNAKGLSYPAVSDWVVPVASANDAGTAMSNFSQRDDHVLVAPGESITSTVPDELFSFDGNPNDWASASGTSMAPPYVAGASVLVREAYAFMGTAGVDQDMIYDALFDTANLIFDPITGGNYHFIDVEAALDSIITDSLADSAVSATDMGMMGDGYQFSELIGKLNDQDYFSFTADATGTMTFNVTGMNAAWDLVGGGGTADGNSFTFDVVSGQTYTLGISSGDGMSHYDVDVQLATNAIDWGVVERNEFNGVTVAGEQWYSITATRAGLATIEAANVGGNSVTLQFYTGDGQQLIDSDVSSSGYNRVDANVLAGETILVRVVGNCDVDFDVWNIVGINGDRADVYGDSSANNFSFAVGINHTVSVNGLTYQLSQSEVHLHGAGGEDSVQITGSTGNDVATLHVGSTSMTGDAYVLNVADFENVTIAGGGGTDRAYMHDSIGNDLLKSKSEWSYLTGDSFHHHVSEFRVVRAYSTAGGLDRAVLFDSAGSDRFVSEPAFAYLKGSGFYNFASGFDSVKAFATAGGLDVAVMNDSSGDDKLIARPDYSYLDGDDYFNYAKGFEEVFAYAGEGKDRAYMYDSVGNDILKSKPEWTYMSGDSFYNYAEGFNVVRGYSTAGGADRVVMYDSAGNDMYVSTPTYAYLKGAGFYNFASGFGSVKAFATRGGNDTAVMHDSAGNDVLEHRTSYSYLKGDGFFNYAKGFETVSAQAQNGGSDQANIRNAVTGDVLQASDSSATLLRGSSVHSANGFDSVSAFAEDLHDPTLELNAIDYVLATSGTWQ